MTAPTKRAARGPLPARPSRMDMDVELTRLREAVTQLQTNATAVEAELANEISRLEPSYREAGRNLAHYLALRQHDVRELQRSLAALGLSSLGRSERCVKPTLAAVSHALACLARGLPVGPVPSRPVNQTAERRAAFGFKSPSFNSGGGTYAHQIPALCGHDHDISDNDRVAFQGIARAGGASGGVFRMISPRPLQIRNVLAIDLIQRGVARPPIVTMRPLPGQESLPFRIAVGRRQFLRTRGGDGLIKRKLFALRGILHGPILTVIASDRA